MNVIPAIDLLDGKCVRLLKGDFEKRTQYSDNPLDIANQFSRLQVSHLHMVDLDGAKSGTARNSSIVQEIAEQTSLQVQLGGGIRSADDVKRWLQSGVSRCVVGSVAMTETERVKDWLRQFGAEHIVLALDIKLDDQNDPYLTSDGWTKSTGVLLWDCLDDYRDAGVAHVLCTDVDRDGAMLGPNFDLYREILVRYPDLQLQASGGIRHADDLRELAGNGLPAAITGRALLDGKISPAEIASLQANE